MIKTTRFCARFISVAIVAMVFSAFGENTSQPRLDRTQLLLYHDRHGKIVEGSNLSAWKKRRTEVLAGMQEIMGPLPGKEKRCPLDVKVIEEVDCGSYVRRAITYASEPNSRVPAYLLIPKDALQRGKKVHAVVCLHPTHMQAGNKTVVGLSTKENRSYAAELAERGYVTLAPAYPIMADYNPDLKALGYKSGTMKAIWDNIRGIDLLESLPYVKHDGVAAIGHSLGGHNSIYTAVFDQRIKVIVSSSGFDSYVDYMNGNLAGWEQERYMPLLAHYKPTEVPFDFYEMIGALAPRAVFINAPLRDSNFKYQSVDNIVAAAKPIFKLYKREDNLKVVHPDCPHDFPNEVRQEAYTFIDAHLR